MYIRCILTKKTNGNKNSYRHRNIWRCLLNNSLLLRYCTFEYVITIFEWIFSRGRRIDCSRELRKKKKKKGAERVEERLYVWVRVCERKRENVQRKLQIRFVYVKMHKRWREFVYNMFSLYAFYFLPPWPCIPPHPLFLESRNVQIEARWWWNRRGETVTGQAAIYLTKSLPTIDLVAWLWAERLIGGGWWSMKVDSRWNIFLNVRA